MDEVMLYQRLSWLFLRGTVDANIYVVILPQISDLAEVFPFAPQPRLFTAKLKVLYKVTFTRLTATG